MTTGDSLDPDKMLSTVFEQLPGYKKYPEYLELIKEPMDLKMCAQKRSRRTNTRRSVSLRRIFISY